MMKQRKEEGDGFASKTNEVVAPRSPSLQKFREQDYWSFVLSLNTYHDEDGPNEAMEKRVAVGNDDNEIRIGIKDWWTKSNYAYLNQPALDSTEPPKKRSSSYVPNYLSYKPKALYPTAIGVF
ncbi:hypothetical protein TanjilG_22868 [Lupinus angustifolius]|uniref:Uncharacterized protein n=1 Tax=Lupinus angustifolius TaxID=3871 RepID=A0A4P1RIE3_LUPAN|nr:hypothetical protein TanjilG_22868 [Lupinus angustifolius]